MFLISAMEDEYQIFKIFSDSVHTSHYNIIERGWIWAKCGAQTTNLLLLWFSSYGL